MTRAEYADKDGDSLHLCASCRDRDDCDARRRYVTTCSDYDDEEADDEDGDDWDM